MATLLFVCTANRYRSPIAEACFRRELSDRNIEQKHTVLSAGTWTEIGYPAMPAALDDAVRLGLDIHQHDSQPITEELMKEADLVLVMEQGQKEALQTEFSAYREKVFLLSEATQGIPYDIPDPVREDVEDDVALEISNLIRTGFDRIIQLSS